MNRKIIGITILISASLSISCNKPTSSGSWLNSLLTFSLSVGQLGSQLPTTSPEIVEMYADKFRSGEYQINSGSSSISQLSASLSVSSEPVDFLPDQLKISLKEIELVSSGGTSTIQATFVDELDLLKAQQSLALILKRMGLESGFYKQIKLRLTSTNGTAVRSGQQYPVVLSSDEFIIKQSSPFELVNGLDANLILETDFSSLVFSPDIGYTFAPQITLKESNLALPFMQGIAIVKFKTKITKILKPEGYMGVGLESTDLILKKYGCGEIYPLSDNLGDLDPEASSAVGFDRTYLLVFGATMDILEVLFQLSADPNVEQVSLNNYVDSSITSPNDPEASLYYSGQQVRYLNRIGAYDGWDISQGDPDMTIAVIDTGVDDGHPDLQGRVVQGPSVIFKSIILPIKIPEIVGTMPFIYTYPDYGPIFVPKRPVYGSSSHGTHVAGIIGATANNSTGGAGINWNSKVLSIPVFSYSSEANDLRTSDIQVALGILEAARRGAKVINMSLGGEGFAYCTLGCTLRVFTNTAERDAVAYAYNKRIVIVASAGNEGRSISTYPGTPQDPAAYPASFNEVISVGALDYSYSYNRRVSFSNFGKVDISAPGTLIYSTILENGSANYNGTSMAAPMVAAFASIILARSPDIHPSMVKEKMCNSATVLTNTDWHGCGRINIGATLTAMNAELPPPQITSNCGAPGQPACWAGMYLQPWSHQFTATGGTPPYVWSYVKGRLPGAAGSTKYNSSGYMWGPATYWWGAGWTFEMKVTDANGNSDIRSFYFASTL